MVIFVNNISISLFEGAKLIDAIRSYYRVLHQTIPEELPIVVDNYGNIIEPDGELSAQSHFYFIDKSNSLSYD
ncbi:MAG: hypothetical protein H6541_11740 [Lentimicrobiaceae bacterium]|nr:hypothetical protein [Lentimicrobiaceae bacterium]